jgi:predicted phage tail protein
VSITQPAAGAPFTAPATVGIAASASDSDGTVAKVEFYNGATKLGEDTSAPYTYDWAGVPAGSYSVTARAIDNLGAQTTSAARVVTVAGGNQAPTTRITSPADGASFPWHPTITIDATASDADGTIARVEFYRADGATLLGSDTSAPYSYRWKNAPSGSHSLRVRAYDNRGAVTLSGAVGITVRAK